jgi:hypothetical protein
MKVWNDCYFQIYSIRAICSVQIIIIRFHLPTIRSDKNRPESSLLPLVYSLFVARAALCKHIITMEKMQIVTGSNKVSEKRKSHVQLSNKAVLYHEYSHK